MPSLPLDLERLTFEMAALQDTNHDSRVRLMLVAKRVYEWIRPILYRVAFVETWAERIQCIRNWGIVQISGVTPFTRHLSVSGLTCQSHLDHLVSIFPNLENLAVWGERLVGSAFLEKLNGLPLRKLCVPNISTDGRRIKYRPTFRNITHLQLASLEGLTWCDCKALVKFPKLTHLCFDVAHKVDNELVRNLLEHCPSLRVLIYLFKYGTKYCTIESDDLRFLVFDDHDSLDDCEEEWEKSIDGRIGLWELAEIIIQARHDKLFDDPSLFAFSRETWTDELNEKGTRWYKEWSRGSI